MRPWVVLLAILLFLLESGLLLSATYVVPQQIPEVSEAIKEAVYGDTILVYPGKYKVQSTLRSGVVLISKAGADSTILWNQRWHILKLVDCDLETVVSGFTFDGKGCNIALACTTGAPTIVNNVIKESWDGISLDRCNALIQGNTIIGCNRGIDMKNSNPEIVDNKFYKNGDAVSIAGSSPIIARCTFDRNTRAILILGHSYPTIGGSLKASNNLLRNAFSVYNNGLRIEGALYTDKPEVAIATHNYWGSDCPDFSRLRGEVIVKPWTNATHDTLFENCPGEPEFQPFKRN
ncbi:MAG: NosD domain-containing protein [bacterium]